MTLTRPKYPSDISMIPCVDLRNFSPKGDGVTDDTDALQNAIDEAESVGLPLYIPAGQYNHTGLIVPAVNFRMIGPIGSVPENQDQPYKGVTADLICTAADTNNITIDLDPLVQPTNVWFENIRFIGNYDDGDGVYADPVPTLGPYNYGTKECAFIGHRIGYNCFEGFFCTHIRSHFYYYQIAGHYGWRSVSNTYDNINFGRPYAAGAIGMWTFGGNDLALNSSNSAENSPADVIQWRVGADTGMTDPNTGAAFLASKSSSILFDGCHFEGATKGYIEIAAGSSANGKSCVCANGEEPLEFAIRYNYLDKLCMWDSCTFGVKGSGHYTTIFDVAGRLKGTGGLIITPRYWGEVNDFVNGGYADDYITGLGVDEGLQFNTPTVAARVYVSGSVQSIDPSTETPIAVTEAIDTMNCFSTPLFTVKVPGIYEAYGKLRIAALASGKYVEARVYVNSSLLGVTRVYSLGEAYLDVPVSDLYNCELDDTIDIRVYHNDTAARDLQNGYDATYMTYKKL